MRTARKHRGFTLTEVLASLALLIIFFDVAGHLFRSTILLGESCQSVSNDSARIDSAVFRLRADVWNAKQLDSPQNGTIQITSADGQQISWRFDADGITRKSANAAEQWANLSAKCTVDAQGKWIEVFDNGQVVRLTGPTLLSQP
jgi:prepilin-type N-terminal cleavage/methylation domain-containing protein